ncbi:MAG: LCP family protein [Chloroflexi bacterium]|nr:LCP family protein [Chloroflexota bacterium]
MLRLTKGLWLAGVLGLVGLLAGGCQTQPNSTPTVILMPTVAPTTLPTQASLPLIVPAVAATSTPTTVPVVIAPSVTPTPEPESLFDALVRPLVADASRRRAERSKQDPEFAKSVDLTLNEGRINFLLYGYGETHEPPVTEKAIIGSYTIISYDLRARQADLISFTHDIRAPEVERAMWKSGEKRYALRMDQAYHVGGFKLQRQMMRNATGLAIDYQVTFRDAVLQSAIDGVFEGVEVDVPVAFQVQPFYLDGKKYDKGYFPQGKQKMNGARVIQFIKTVPVTEGYYGKELEHNTRKHLVFNALLDMLAQKQKEPKFWLNLSTFITKESLTGTIAYDFDVIPLAVNNIREATASLDKLSKSSSRQVQLPKIGRTLYIVDPAHGDGGVRWVEGDAIENPISKKDIETNIYPHLAYEVPSGANPYGDLVTEYWRPVRVLLRDRLTSPALDALPVHPE